MPIFSWASPSFVPTEEETLTATSPLFSPAEEEPTPSSERTLMAPPSEDMLAAPSDEETLTAPSEGEDKLRKTNTSYAIPPSDNEASPASTITPMVREGRLLEVLGERRVTTKTTQMSPPRLHPPPVNQSVGLTTHPPPWLGQPPGRGTLSNPLLHPREMIYQSEELDVPPF